MDLGILDFLFGARRFHFTEEERDRVYRLLYGESATVLRAEHLPSGFSVLLPQSDAKRILPRLSEMGIAPLSDRRLGVPYFCRCLLGRCGILIGFLLAILLFFYSRSRVWEIRLSGEGAVDPDQMLEILASAGVYEGMSADSLDPELAVSQILESNRGIAWMQIRRRGVIATAEWIPTVSPSGSQVKPQGVGASLISTHDAIIEDVRVDLGLPSIEVGAVLHAGDLLVSGVGTHSAVYATGEVIGRVRETLSVFVPFEEERQACESSRVLSRTLSIFGKSFTVGSGGDGGVIERSNVYLFGRIRLPIVLETRVTYEYRSETAVIDQAQAAKLAQRELASKLAQTVAGGELLSSRVSGEYGETGYTLTAEIEYLINIAKTLEFSIQNE